MTRWAGRSSSRPSFWPMRNSPPGMRTRSSGVIFEKGELQFALVGVHAVKDHPHFVADRKLTARVLPDHLADVLLISVLVAGQRVERHQSFDKQVGEFH